jgi:hypothetical protein
LIDKSIEAFIMGLEIYNKPTICYRVEGFSFFICNAWELMLKAKMIRDIGEKSIYYKDNENRTLSLENCIKKVFTNNKDPLRINLEKIIELRNISTHYITEEYEQIYIPLFQSCVINYSNKLLEFFNEDITKKVSQNFITLSINMKEFDSDGIKARYPKDIADKIIKTKDMIWQISNQQNEKFSINIKHEYYLTKNKNQAVAEFRIAKDADEAIFITKELQDPNETHKYTLNNCLEIINNSIRKNDIKFIDQKGNSKFNKYHFSLFSTFHNFKGNTIYCYAHKIGNNIQFTYSNKVIDLIIEQVEKAPNTIISTLIKNTKK